MDVAHRWCLSAVAQACPVVLSSITLLIRCSIFEFSLHLFPDKLDVDRVGRLDLRRLNLLLQAGDNIAIHLGLYNFLSHIHVLAIGCILTLVPFIEENPER